jgi:Type IV secretion-system coupling protein DNA-binding domain/TraM recognition site of TraD and TraG
MATVHEQLSEQFFRWERRGRGWQVFDMPVSIEPPFVPFTSHYQPETPAIDDGHRPTFLSSLFQKKPAPKPLETEPEEEPEPTPLIRGSLVEFQASLPEKLDVTREAFEQFLLNLSLCREPIAFELLGVHRRVTAQFAAASTDAPLLRRQLQAFFPEAAFVSHEHVLDEAWDSCEGDEALAVEFGLGREFMFSLRSGKIDPFIGIVGALSELLPGELGLFQVLWQPVHERWAESIVASVTDADGKAFFVNSPELTTAAEDKITSPLFAAVVRILIRARKFDRVLQLASDLAGSLRIFANPSGNELIPLKNDDYPFESHVEDTLARQSRRSGMILNSDELIGFVHLPGSAVRSPALQRQIGKTKAAPAIVRQKGLLVGYNEHNGETVEVRLTPEQRVRHSHVLGASGTGKSTLLFNLIRQSVESGEGIAVLDPHGDLIDRILGVIPEERIDDVILVDPSDDQYAVGFNILSAHSDLEKNLLASDLVAVFQRLSISWGDQMNSVLQNAILAFLESDRKGTIADMRRFLIEPAFRADFLKSVKDSEVVYYWQKSFPLLSGGKSIGPILTRLENFLGQKPIRYMVSQPENRLDFAEIMDGGKIFLAKLPEGLLGRENSYLLGSLLISKLQQTAMSRQAQRVESRRLFTIIVDEFSNFITPSMAEILTNARKYRVSLTLAHQELQQLERNKDVASAVLSHPFARIVFRVGDDDAKKLADGFSYFEAQDLRNLETGHALARIERSDYDFNLSVPLPEEPDNAVSAGRREEVTTVSRKKYGMLRRDVEAMLATARAATPKDEPIPAVVAPVPVVVEPPKVADVPKAVEPPKPPPQPPAAPNVKHGLPRDLGRGGEQHKAIQQRIKKAAEELGFRSTIEKPVLDGLGSIDLFLERDGQNIACEISLSTTIDHEVGNVSKCLKAGVPAVAVVCLDDERLRKLEKAIVGSLGSELAARVRYFQPDPFIAHLKQLKPPTPQPSETSYGGYKVKRTVPQLSPQERRQKEDLANRIIAEAMRGK